MSSLSFALTAALSSLWVSSHGSLAAFSARLMIALQTCFDASWPNITAPSICSSDSSLASDSTIITALGDLGRARVEDIFAVLEADAGGADRAHEGDARDGEGSRGGDHRQDVGLV